METLISTSSESRQIHGSGTSEREWLQDSPLTSLPFSTCDTLVPAGRKAVVIAPHPDDEVLPCGGLLAQLAALRREVIVVALTDGESSHPKGSWWTPRRLKMTRPLESAEALRMLDCEFSLVRLGLPDGGVVNAEDRVIRELEGLLDPGDSVFSPWSLDGHPDHEAAAEAGFIACAQRGARFIEMPIWGWHWADATNAPMPWGSAVRLALSPSELIRKTRAIGSFLSQLTVDPLTQSAPILSASTLERFVRPWEVFFPPPHPL